MCSDLMYMSELCVCKCVCVCVCVCMYVCVSLCKREIV